jgi:hypothetical protein
MSTPLPEALPYGMRDLKVTPYADAQGSILGSVSYDLPNMQTLTFNETEEYEELRGDDRLVAVHGNGAQVEWDLEAGGLALPIWAIFTGGQIIESGTTPNRVMILRKRSTDQRPYFRLDGQIISDSGGDVVARIYRAKCNGNIGGDFADGQFFVTAVDGIGLPLPDDDNDLLYDIIYHETKVTLGNTPIANPVPVPTNVTVGSITSTGATVTWTAVTGATAYHLQTSDDDGVTWEDVTPDPTTNSKALSGLTSDTDYLVRVLAIVGGNSSEYSTPVEFSTTA